MKTPTPQHQARQALKAALNGRAYGDLHHRLNEPPISETVRAFPTSDGAGVVLTKEAARLIDQLLTRAHYEGELGKAEKEG